MHITDTNVPIPTKFSRDKDHQILFVGGPNRRITNLRWHTAAILINRKKAISPQRLDLSALNLAG